MRRVINDALISACALGVLVIGLVAMDGRLREQVFLHSDLTTASNDVAGATSHAQRLTGMAVQIVKEQADEHGPLMAMLVVGVVLMVIMFRT